MQPVEREDIPVLVTKVILFGLIIITCLILFIVAPKRIISNDFPFMIATSLAITDESNMLLFDYKVYATEERFNEGMLYDVEKMKLAFRERSEIMAIKIYGENESIQIKDDYVFIVDQDTPELNIEYYLIKDMMFDEMSFPVRTFIILVNDLKPVINHIYLAFISLATLLILTPTTVKFVNSSIQLKKLMVSS